MVATFFGSTKKAGGQRAAGIYEAKGQGGCNAPRCSAVCHAVGILHPTDSRELHNRPLQIKVTVRRDDNGEFRNDVKGFSKIAPQAAPAAKNAPTASDESPVAATGQLDATPHDTAPWASNDDIPF